MLLLHGDCLEMMREIPDKSVDCVIADLPYGCTACPWDTPIDLAKFWCEMDRVLHDDKSPVIFTCTTRFGHTLIASRPDWFKYDIVWQKNGPTGFLWAGRMPMREHESIYVFGKKFPRYLRDDNHRVTHVSDPRQYGGPHEIYGVRVRPIPHRTFEPPLLRSVWNFAGHPKLETIQGTQKPVALLERLVKYYCPAGGCVLDPTMGSGTAGIACLNLGREFIGIEMDEKNFNQAAERLYSHEQEVLSSAAAQDATA